MKYDAKRRLEYVISTHAIENLTPSDDALKLCAMLSAGEISADDAVALILQKYTVQNCYKESNCKKEQATTQLMDDLAKGLSSAEQKGWLTLGDVEISLGLTQG